MRKTTKLILCALFAAFVAVGAFLKIPIPNVPVTLQTLFVLLAGMFLGGKMGAVSCLVYLAVGLLGLPVFTQGGGLMYLTKPTFGYLLGFVGCAYVTGTLTERLKCLTVPKLFGAGLLGITVSYAVGMLHLFLVKDLYISEGTPLFAFLTAGVAICIPIDIVSCFICALIAKRMRPHIKQYI